MSELPDFRWLPGETESEQLAVLARTVAFRRRTERTRLETARRTREMRRANFVAARRRVVTKAMLDAGYDLRLGAQGAVVADTLQETVAFGRPSKQHVASTRETLRPDS